MLLPHASGPGALLQAARCSRAAGGASSGVGRPAAQAAQRTCIGGPQQARARGHVHGYEGCRAIAGGGTGGRCWAGAQQGASLSIRGALAASGNAQLPRSLAAGRPRTYVRPKRGDAPRLGRRQRVGLPDVHGGCELFWLESSRADRRRWRRRRRSWRAVELRPRAAPCALVAQAASAQLPGCPRGRGRCSWAGESPLPSCSRAVSERLCSDRVVCEVGGESAGRRKRGAGLGAFPSARAQHDALCGSVVCAFVAPHRSQTPHALRRNLGGPRRRPPPAPAALPCGPSPRQCRESSVTDGS